jgi:hypothetical protein
MNLTGPLSARIGNLGRLYNLRLRHNSLTGTLPTELANLLDLRTFITICVLYNQFLFAQNASYLLYKSRFGLVSLQSV